MWGILGRNHMIFHEERGGGGRGEINCPQMNIEE